MGGATVDADRLVFTTDDHERQLVAVGLDCDEAVPGGRRFRRTATGWALSLPRPPLDRIEYRLALTDRSGRTDVVCDPANPERVQTAFGDRSVVLLPGYAPPGWLAYPGEPGTLLRTTHHDDTVGELPIDIWSPAGVDRDTAAHLLVVHDGPEYAALSQLTGYAAAMIGTGTLPAFRLALMQPVARDEWYAANPAYVAATLDWLDHLGDTIPVRGRPAIMGASLGGLCALMVALAAPERFSAVLSQSGSFFTTALDSQEASHPHFGRVAESVAVIHERAASGVQAPPGGVLDVALTCGVLEENHANNAAMAEALERLGHRVHLHDVADLHNYTAWRDSLDPALTDLLRSAWSATG